MRLASSIAAVIERGKEMAGVFRAWPKSPEEHVQSHHTVRKRQ